MTKQEYRPRANALMVEWTAEFDMDEVMDFETEGGMASLTRRAFEFFFMPVLTTEADLSEEVG